MVKVSISLPNNAHITFEAEESEVLHGVVGLVLRDLPRDLMQSAPSNDENSAEIISSTVPEKSTASATSPLQTATIITEPVKSQVPSIETQSSSQHTVEPKAPAQIANQATVPTSTGLAGPIAGQRSGTVSIEKHEQTPGLPTEVLSESGRADFESFCQNANPLGDMRRVVVATVGANRHFGMDGVNAEDLAWLFDVASWRKPGNFTQTLRNAARSKFGWLERIPGRSGRYAATPLGISKTLTAD